MGDVPEYGPSRCFAMELKQWNSDGFYRLRKQ